MLFRIKAEKYTCASDFPTIPVFFSFFFFFCQDPKHDQTFYFELKENYM